MAVRTEHVRFPSTVVADEGTSMAELRQLAPLVGSVRITPEQTLIAVGDTFSLTRFNLSVLDSAGKEIGRTRRSGFSMHNGALDLIQPPVVRGSYSGPAVVTLEFPRTAWVGRSDSVPGATLRVSVGAPQTAPSVAESWGVRLSGRVHADVFSVRSPGAEVAPPTMRAIVLWRAQPGWCARPCRGFDTRTLDDSLTTLRERAVAATRAGSGGSANGVLWWAELARSGDSIYVRGSAIALGAPDSTLVIVVDRVDAVGGAPEIVATTRVPARPLPAVVNRWPTRNLVAPMATAGAAVTSMVRQSPKIAAFLDLSRTTAPPGFER
jgi:hypothetical protein